MSIDAGSNAAGEAGTGKPAFKVARGSGTPANDAAERPGEAGQLMKPLVWPPGSAVSTVVAAHGQERAGLAAAALGAVSAAGGGDEKKIAEAPPRLENNFERPTVTLYRYAARAGASSTTSTRSQGFPTGRAGPYTHVRVSSGRKFKSLVRV